MWHFPTISKKTAAKLAVAGLGLVALTTGLVTVSAASPGTAGQQRGRLSADVVVDQGTEADQSTAELEELQTGLSQNPVVLAEGESNYAPEGHYRIILGANEEGAELRSFCIEVTGGGGGCEIGLSHEFKLLLWDGVPIPYLAWQAPDNVESIIVTWEGGDTTAVPIVRPTNADGLGFAATLMPAARINFTYVAVDSNGNAVSEELARPPLFQPAP